MRRISSNSESGAILAIVIILMLALTITGIAFLNAGVMEYRLASREVHKNKAFYIAEGGLERTLWNLKQDFVSGGGEWEGWEERDEETDNKIRINGVLVDETNDNVLRYDGLTDGSVELGEGSYVVKLQFIDTDDLWAISTGIVKDIPRTVRIRVKAVNVSAWNNAIFAKHSALGGTVISGNVRVAGSVLILGEEGAAVPVMDMGGAAGIRNNYQDMPAPLALKVPSIVNEKGIETLDAALRVRDGQVRFQDAGVTVGEEPPNDPIKRTMDEVHVPGGFVIGTGGEIEDHVFTDNEDPLSPCELIDAVTFPSLLDPYIDPVTGDYVVDPVTGEPITHLAYLREHSLFVTMGPGEDQIPETGISYEFPRNISDPEGKGSISWSFNPDKGLHGVVELEIEGIVWIEADSLSIGEKLRPIEYSGRGVIVVADEGTEPGDNPIIREIEVHGDLLAQGDYDTGGGFPVKNALGLVTGTLYIAYPGEAGLNLTGAFFAENAIHSSFQNEIAGTFVSNFFDIASHVPRIYQVPKLATNVPEGMPGAPPTWTVTTSQWSES